MDFLGLGGTASNIIGTAYNIWNAERNFNLQKDNLAYQKRLQKKIFAREDSSLQRRVADAEAAGLNPQLALGSGAGAGQVVSVSAPQHEAPKIDFLNEAIAFQKGIKELELLNSEKVGRDHQNSLLSLEEQKERHDLDYYTSRGLPSNASGQYVQMLQALGSIIKYLKGDKSNKTVGGVLEDLIPKGKDAFAGVGDIGRVSPQKSDVVTDINPDEELKGLKKEFSKLWKGFKRRVGTFGKKSS